MSQFRQIVFLGAMAAALVAFGCSQADKSGSKSGSSGQLDEKPLLTEEDSVEAMLNEALVRLSYGDKSGLYDLEFEYLQDEYDYDGYLKMRQIEWAQMDTLDHMELKEIIHQGEDSALVKIVYVFKGLTGKVHNLPDEFHIYRQYDEWKKPTASTFAEQKEYEKLMREAIEAAEGE